MPGEQPGTESAPSAYKKATHKSRLHLVYFSLAAFDVLAVCLGLYLSARTSEIYTDSVNVNRAWAERQNNYLALSQLASAVNAPGNDVFDSGAVAQEAARMKAARQAFDTRFDLLTAELRANVDPKLAAFLLRDFDAIREAMDKMGAEAALIFGYFAQNEPAKAGARMATMDRAYASVHRALEALSRDVAAVQDRNFITQTAMAARISRLEYPISACVLIMVCGAIVYGRKIEKRMSLAAEERERSLRELEESHRELTKAREDAEAANRAKSAFLANMSHELRSPLSSVINFAGLLEEELEDRQLDELLPDVRKITGASRHLLGIVNDVLDLSKIEAGRMDLAVGAFSLNRAMRDVVETAEPLAARKGNRVVVEPWTASEAIVENDEQKFRQSLMNLVSNACKFTEKGEVRVSVEAKGGEGYEVRVRDSGIGMSPEQLSRLFGAFEQVDASAGRRFGGTGLGLAISRKYCRMMGGDITVESEAGRGSTFTISLPLTAPSRGD